MAFTNSHFKRLNYEILQISDTESGVVALGGILAHYGLFSDLAGLKNLCGVTIEEMTPEQLLNAAIEQNLQGDWIRVTEKKITIPHGNYPQILYDEDQTYRILLGFDGNRAFLYDCKRGNTFIRRSELQYQQSIYLTPTGDFKTGGHSPKVYQKLFELLAPVESSLKLIALIGTARVVPLLLIAACSSQFINNFIDQERLSFGLPIVWLMTLSMCVSLFLTYARFLASRRCAYVLTKLMSVDIFENIVGSSYEYLQQRDRNELAARMLIPWYVPDIIFNSFVPSVVRLWTNSLVLVFSVLISPELFVLLLLGVIATGYMTYKVTKESLPHQAIQAKEYNDAFSTGMSCITSLEGIKGEAIESVALRKWQEHFLVIVDVNQKLGKLSIARNLTISGAVFAIKALLLGVGGLLILNGRVTLGTLIAFLFIEEQVAGALYAVPNLAQSWQSLDAYMRLYYDLSCDKDTQSKSLRRSEDCEPMDLLPHPLSISFESVHYRYSDKQPYAIKDISFQISTFDSIAVTGDSQSGKSTLLAILAGLIAPIEGRVCVGQKEIKTGIPIIPADICWFNSIPMIYQGTFRQNISLFNDEVSASEIFNVANMVGLHSYVYQFQHAYSHVLRSNDSVLPISIRYKIELARVLLFKPSLIIMDSLDSQIDESLHLEILGLIKSSASRIVYVTRRHKIAEHSQYLICLSSGEINCCGPSNELLEQLSTNQCLRSHYG